VSAERVLLELKTRGPSTAARVARRLGVTPMAVRQHLYRLRREGLVDYSDERRPVGRPARLWRLSSRAHSRFPDSHAELAVGVIRAVRRAFGQKGLDRVVAERRRRALAAYRARIPARAPLARRVAALARLRREEGYMAEWRRDADGALLLIENHCPINPAARVCPSLCGAELDLFRAVLGRAVAVGRTEHILAGQRRCAYRIAPKNRPKRFDV
jgi:predicted ArsR family transcriptional regulator